MRVEIIETSSLGDRSYVVSDGRIAVVIDPQRDIDRVLGLASDPLLRAEERRKWRAIHVSVNQHMKRKYGSDR